MFVPGTGLPVLPVYNIDPFLSNSKSKIRQSFIYEGLTYLDESLHKIGSYLKLRQGKSFDILGQLCSEYDVAEIFAQEDYSPYAQTRDSELLRYLILKIVTDLMRITLLRFLARVNRE